MAGFRVGAAPLAGLDAVAADLAASWVPPVVVDDEGLEELAEEPGPLVCLHCSSPFEAGVFGQVYCAQVCRQRAKEARKLARGAGG